MRGGVMHVGGDPDRVADAGMLDERQQLGDLELAPRGGPSPCAIRVLTDQ